MNVFLPIKPKYAFAISDGIKKYEFRKICFNERVKRVIVYASSPYKKIIGYFKVKKIHKSDPNTLWKRFNHSSGVDKKDFFEYFEGSLAGVSIEIEKFYPLKNHIEPNRVFSDFSIPQSFKYISSAEFNLILEQERNAQTVPI